MMHIHFEILVEDNAGKKMLNILVPRIIGSGNTFRVHSYKGIGHIPKGLRPQTDADKRILLDQLPRLLNGFGQTFCNYGADYHASVIVICDLDNKNKEVFLGELQGILNNCRQQPETRFCLAIEEGEAWLLGDISAIMAAYPNANNGILKKYVNDSICGTWEILADAIYPNGSGALSKRGWSAIGAVKSEWAEKISPNMDVDNNSSPSFNDFKNKLLALVSQ